MNNKDIQNNGHVQKQVEFDSEMKSSFMGITELLVEDDDSLNIRQYNPNLHNNMETQDVELLDEIEALMRQNTL